MTEPFALIIEDDPQLGDIFIITLQGLGFTTALDTTGEQYPKYLAGADPALIVLDLHLPFASGLDILHQIRSEERLKNTPIIVTTADIHRGNAITEPGVEVLIKPVSVTRLISSAAKYLSGDQAARQANANTLNEKGNQ